MRIVTDNYDTQKMSLNDALHIITLEPCHCIGPLLNRYHCDAHDVGKNPHNNQHDDHVMIHDDRFFVVCSSAHCLFE